MTQEADFLFQSALQRADHMSQAILQIRKDWESSAEARRDFLTCVEELSSCAGHTTRTAHFVAVGKSALVAQTAVAMLVSVGISARFLHPTEALHGDLGSVRAGDFCVLISYGGRSNEILEVLPSLLKRNTSCVALTSRLQSPLAQKTGRTLLLPQVEECCPLNQAPVTSAVVTLAFCQILVAATMEKRGFALPEYAQNHPGGAIGKRIFVVVDDLMTKGNHLPVLPLQADFKSCLSLLTSAALGAVLVTDAVLPPSQQGISPAEHDPGHLESSVLHPVRLAGIITEKDLRVAIEKVGPGVFDLKAADLMNPRPLLIQTQTLAAEALTFMENRPKPLNVLPVVDGDQNIRGLLRIHDLLSAGF